MLDFGYYNMDCMQGMKEFPDKYFDLAIVDPPFGGGQSDDGKRKNEADLEDSSTNIILTVRAILALIVAEQAKLGRKSIRLMGMQN